MDNTIEEHWKNLKWKKIDNNVQSFQLDEEPEIIHIIKTGFVDKYMVVREDAYELNIADISHD